MSRTPDGNAAPGDALAKTETHPVAGSEAGLSAGAKLERALMENVVLNSELDIFQAVFKPETEGFDRNFDVSPGQCVQVSPMVRRVLANNASPYTFKGTSTFIVGRGRVAVIDPGPDDEDHLAALLAALDGETVAACCIDEDSSRATLQATLSAVGRSGAVKALLREAV